MAFSKRNSIFTDLYEKRHDLYFMYINSINTFTKDGDLSQLANFTAELTEGEYDFNKIEDINKAISLLTKFRRSQLRYLTRFTLDGNDFKKEYNNIVAALNGLRCIEILRNNIPLDDIENVLPEIIEYENDDSNPDIRATRALRVAEADLTKTLYEIYNNKFRCEALCKIAKSIVNRLQRHRNVLLRG